MLSGDHVVNPDIKMAAGDPIITVAIGSSLTLGGVLSDAGTASAGITLVSNGNGADQDPLNRTYGTLNLTGLNTFTGPIVMSGYGRLVVSNVGGTDSANALGMSSADPANLVISGFLAYTSASSATLSRGFTLAGNGVLDGIEVANADVNLTLTGPIAIQGVNAFRKTGPGTLTFANGGTNTLAPGDFQVGEGAVVFDGGTFNKVQTNIGFQEGYGDFFVGDTAGVSATLTVQNGAQVKNDGNLIVGLTGSAGTMNITGASTFTAAAANLGTTGGTATLSMGGSATLTIAGGFSAGSEDPATVGTLLMTGSSLITVNGGGVALAFGNNSGTFVGTLGTLHGADNPTITATNGSLNYNMWGGAGTLTMNANSSIVSAAGDSIIGCNASGINNVSANTKLYMNDNASIQTTDMYIGWGLEGYSSPTLLVTMTGTSHIVTTGGGSLDGAFALGKRYGIDNTLNMSEALHYKRR